MSTVTDASTSGTPSGSAGVLTVRETGLAPLQAPLLPPTYSGGDSLDGTIDYARVWHAFRRRWPSAVTLGLLFATLASVPVWLFFPRSFEAAVWLRVRDKSGMLTGGSRDNAEYEAYRKTQLQLIKSPFVLTSALRRPGIAELPTVREEIDPVDWLARSIQITAPMDSEVVQVRLRGKKAADVTKLVNAVTSSYLDEVVNKERTERLGRRDALEKKYKENMSELRSRRETFNTLARTLGTRDSSEVATQRSLLLDHLGSLRSQMQLTQSSLAAIDAELDVLDAHAKGTIAADDIVSDQAVEAALLQDEQLGSMNARLAAIEESIVFQSRRSARGLNDPAVKRLRAEREDLLAGIASYAKTVRPRVVAQLAAEAVGGRVSQGPSMLKMRRETLGRSLAKVTAEFDAVSKEVTELGKANADMEARQGEIEQLQQVTDQIGLQLETSSIDLAMPNRVQIIEEAGVPVSGDKKLRTMLTAMAGLVGLVLGGGGIVLLEYLRDRLNATDEIQQRVGVRLLGTLPRISRSRQRGAEGLVIESVDGIRTVIAQSGREAPRVILVTSAVEHEGKTTVASQLAASLARSDRRTLILDGDLRHPNVHLALELELGPGLPELLRGEIGNDEAVKPTSIDGLFAVTGGACDYAAVTALSRPELARVIKGFRDSFDHVVIDAGPVLAFADSLLLGQQCDVAILATMRDVSSLPAVNAAVDRLREVGVRVLGAVVNGVAGPSPRRMYASPLPG
jgi:capsular exopolysaccharide synthesis family protein